MPQLDTSNFLSQIFWLILAFAVLYIYLNSFIIPKLENIIESREGATSGNMEKATLLQNKISLLQQKIDAESHMTNNKVMEMHKEFAAKINLIRQKHLEQINSEFLKNQELVKANIDEDKKQSVAQMHIYVIEYADSVLEKITGQKTDYEKLKKSYSKLEVSL